MTDLPWYKQWPHEWDALEMHYTSLRAQVLYGHICSLYWTMRCNVTVIQLKRRQKSCDKPLMELVDVGDVRIEDGKIRVPYLDAMWTDAIAEHEKNVANGKKGALIRKTKREGALSHAVGGLEPPLSQSTGGLKQPLSIKEVEVEVEGEVKGEGEEEAERDKLTPTTQDSPTEQDTQKASSSTSSNVKYSMTVMRMNCYIPDKEEATFQLLCDEYPKKFLQFCLSHCLEERKRKGHKPKVCLSDLTDCINENKEQLKSIQEGQP